MRISVHYNDAPARGFFNRLKQSIAGPIAPRYWKIASIAYYQFVQQGFDREGHPQKWDQLSPTTIKRRRKGKNRTAGLRIRILRDTGQLLRSATSPEGAGYRDIQPRRMIIGSRLRYAGYHHTGTRNMPQRRFFQHNPEILHRMGDLMTRAALRDAKA